MDPKLFNKDKYKQKPSRETERENLVQYFVDELNISRRGKLALLTPGRMRKVFEGLEKKDLYYMKSQFEDRLRRNSRDSASKYFWWSLKPQNREELLGLNQNNGNKKEE